LKILVFCGLSFPSLDCQSEYCVPVSDCDILVCLNSVPDTCEKSASTSANLPQYPLVIKLCSPQNWYWCGDG